ncbi:NAC transcription factor 29 [Acorus gramineus]|uniref:NAC transcription factor 29 n=1 Tax=Acorus gramineus TaxID=55184 RepID=A0AAV9B3Q3_ACOGR|nr:NAC transcription factor 29 [Acorus gramineus]
MEDKPTLVKLPPGFRFHPTDEELIVHYLKRKVSSSPLPARFIPDVDLCRFDPWDLPGDLERERYFFCVRSAKYPNGSRSNRAGVSGYWKATGKDRQVLRGGQVVGVKKSLVFYKGKAPSGSRTDWVMHEYRLAATTNGGGNSINENWVLCRIFPKRKSSSGCEGEVELRHGFIDFMSRDRARADSESTSCVTAEHEHSTESGEEDCSSSLPRRETECS